MIAVAMALLAMTFIPTASAHWRGNDVPSWDAPHEHDFVLHSTTSASIYSVSAQRLCLNTVTLVVSWSSPVDGSCPAGQTPVSPLRGLNSGGINCFDLDSVGHANYLKVAPRQNGISSVIFDWGSAAISTGPGVGAGTYNVADYYAHPVKSAQGGVQGSDANPTGATAPFFPVHVQTVPGVLQLDITYIGMGALGTGTGGTSAPGIDFGDNDPEFCRGGAIHTFAIDSGDAKMARVGGVNGPVQAVDGGGIGLNDIRGIGGDGVYDVTPIVSSVIGTGGSVPRSSATPVGLLVSASATLDGSAPIRYGVCRGIIAGCTNIPTAGTAARLGNGAGDDAVYSSLQDCVWKSGLTGRAHATSGNVYRGQAAFWASDRENGNTCWPERLVRVSPTVGTLYFPSSQSTATTPGTANGIWAPERLAATSGGVESFSVFVDQAGTQPFHNFNSGCAPGTTLNPTSPFCAGGPTVAPPTQWVAAPNTISATSAVFQAP